MNHYFKNIALFAMLGLWCSLSFSPALSEVFLWIAFGFWVLSLVASKSSPLLPDKTGLVLIGLFFAAVMISMFVSDYHKQSTRGLFKLVRHFLILLLALNIFSLPASFQKWRSVALVAFLVLVMNGFVQYFHGVDALRGFLSQPSQAGVRLSGSFETYGKFAAYLCVTLPIVLFCTWQILKNKTLRAELLLWIPLSLGGTFLMYATRSRGGIIAFFSGLLLLLFLRKSWKCLGLLFLCAIVFISALPKSMLIHLDKEKKEQSLVERFELWHRALDVIRARPLTGTGINTYAVAHQKYDTRKSWRVQNYYAHSGYLQMAAEIGLPGTLAFVFFLIYWIIRNRPRSNENDAESEIRWGILGGIIAFLIFCMADTALHSPQPVMTFWYAMGLLGATNPHLNRPA